jgi:hypothetical protein
MLLYSYCAILIELAILFFSCTAVGAQLLRGAGMAHAAHTPDIFNNLVVFEISLPKRGAKTNQHKKKHI